MTAFVLKDAEMRFGGRDITGLLNSIALGYGAEMQDGTVFGDDTRKRLAGLIESSAQINGFFDDTDESDKDFFDAVGALLPTPFSAVPQGGVPGDRAFFLNAHQAAFNPGGSIGEILPFTGDLQSDGPLVRGTILESAILTTSGNGNAFQVGALADANERMYAILQVVAVSGTAPTLDLTIESDDDSPFPSPATQITFNQVGSAVASQFAFLPGPLTDDWWRAEWTIAGGTPSFTAFVAIGKLTLT
jgi:hypothetical protein